MKTWGLETEIAILLFLVTLPLIIAPLVYGHFRRFGKWHGWPAVVMLGTIFYGCGVVAFTMFPLPVITAGFCEKHEALRHWNWEPFRFVPGLMSSIKEKGVLESLGSAMFLAEVFNVVMTFPLGFILVYRFRSSVRKSVLIGFLVSLAIELTQHTAIWGVYSCPYRVSELDDLIMNTFGALLGGLVARRWGHLLPDVHPRADQLPRTPTLGRRVVAGLLDVVVVTLVAAFAELVVAIWTRRSGGDLPGVFSLSEQVVAIVLAPLVLFFLFPMIRKDGATVGQVCVFLRPERMGGGALTHLEHLKKFGSRWFPWMFFAFLAPIGIAFPVLILVELGTALARQDRRSLSSVIGASVTRDSRKRD